MPIEWSYWPQYKHFTITRTRKVRGAEEEVVVIVLSERQAKKFAKIVQRFEEEGL